MINITKLSQIHEEVVILNNMGTIPCDQRMKMHMAPRNLTLFKATKAVFLNSASGAYMMTDRIA